MRDFVKNAAMVAALLLFLTTDVLAARQVVVIYSDSARQTLRTVSGLELNLKEAEFECSIKEVYLTGSQGPDKQAIEAVHPELLLTIGSSATAFADRTFPALPVVFAKVLNPIESGFIQSWDQPGRHITGAALDIPAEVQLQKFTSMIPKLKKVGVIYTENTRRLVDEARKAATSLGLQIVPYEITSAKQLPQAIDSLCRSVEGIWTVADEELSSPQFVRFILLETLRSRIPVMGFNQTFVESGALFCLEADYKYIGRQAASIALQVLGGADPGKTKVTVPDIIYLYLNLKTSKLLNLILPPEMVSVAKETY
jgi:putative tryptophan/tyrosine transport system substrate-binding protein